MSDVSFDALSRLLTSVVDGVAAGWPGWCGSSPAIAIKFGENADTVRELP
ncbi:hypothetical protein H7H78_00955 [Mycobacterium shinjukuense]|nr:hypothetical protein [Mycobacterium shinjukuense]MCV6984068.1 hypothetical protein [Mycobacterium shinjukuense]